MPVPRIAISLGDPFGIGPEVVVAALADPTLRGAAQWIIHGSSQPMLEAIVRGFWLPAFVAECLFRFRLLL